MVDTLPDITDEIRSAPRKGHREKNWQAMLAVLDADERVHLLYAGVSIKGKTSTGNLLLTDRRVLFSAEGVCSDRSQSPSLSILSRPSPYTEQNSSSKGRNRVWN